MWGLVPDGVVESYFQTAGDWLDGYAPYAEFKVAYPPAALLWLTLPGIFTGTVGNTTADKRCGKDFKTFQLV